MKCFITGGIPSEWQAFRRLGTSTKAMFHKSFSFSKRQWMVEMLPTISID